MREILFRGKRVDNYVKDSSVDYAEKGVGEWVYGDIIHRRYYKNRDVIVIRTEDSGFDNYSDYEVDPETLGQYTGLTDKNGKKIFEGDIVEYKGRILQVEYSEKYASFFFHNNGSVTGECISTNTKEYAEVIGNIIDSPQFLEDDE